MSEEPEPADAALIAATVRGDEAAFAVLVRRYIRSATLLAAQLLRDRTEAEDVVQESFTIVFAKAARFDPARPFPPWLFAIVRRLAQKRRARDARRARLLRLWTRAGEPSITTENAWIATRDVETAGRAVHALPPMQRACFELVTMRGLTTADVAAMHGISESTVRQHLFRARAALRAKLKTDEDDHG
ncbi:MAG: RNA polymerase sigma factor [Vicinamibacterales bacterium]